MRMPIPTQLTILQILFSFKVNVCTCSFVCASVRIHAVTQYIHPFARQNILSQILCSRKTEQVICHVQFPTLASPPAFVSLHVFFQIRNISVLFFAIKQGEDIVISYIVQ